MNAVAPLLKRRKRKTPRATSMSTRRTTPCCFQKRARKRRETARRAGLLPEGRSLYEPAYVNLMHHLNAALRAHNLFFRDRHYVVRTVR